MKQFELNGILRENMTKGQLNDLRAQGYVAGVLYGDNIKENINLFFYVNDLNGLIYTDDVYLITLKVEGKVYKTVVKSFQFHPLSDLPVHVDLMEVDDNKVIKIWYPIHFTGTAEGTMEGGKVYKKLRKIQLKASVSALPEELTVDISPLKIGDTLKINDLDIPGVEILTQATTPIVSVAKARAVVEEVVTIEGEEEGEGEEGEEKAETAAE